ncbi:MAG TPA: DUF4265 domain-containing protein [Pyrinomonadaceae bacterium]|nr:DUF4265 domain-containing protein [Pyrinomonadaceae bacterium]
MVRLDMRLTLEEKLRRLATDPAWTTVVLSVEPGSAVVEEVLVERRDDGNLRVASSPGMIDGLAADDIIVLDAQTTKGYRLVTRGRNVCVHVFREAGDAAELRLRLEPLVESIGGWLDATMGASGLCFTIPVHVGFATIESSLRSVVGDDWYYSNVYDEATNAPLNWWC